MKKTIFSLLIAFISTLSASAALTGDWKQYNTFDNSVSRLVATPEGAYFIGLAQSVNENVPELASEIRNLFFYDREGGELRSLNRRTGLSGDNIVDIYYNGMRGYLLVVYSDGDLDFLYPDGEVRNVAALKNAQIQGSKKINDVFFYAKGKQVLISTDFGYLLIDDEKHQVKESRNYNEKITTAAIFAGNMYLVYDGGLVSAPLSQLRLSIGDYRSAAPAELQGVTQLLDMGADDKYLTAYYLDSSKHHYQVLQMKDGVLSFKRDITLEKGNSLGHSRTNDGWLLLPRWTGTPHLSYDDKLTSRSRNAADNGLTIATWNHQDYYTVTPRKGLKVLKAPEDKSQSVWEVTADYMMPNAPTVYLSRAMAYHPRYGMLVNSVGPESLINDQNVAAENLYCGLKGGMWTPLSPAYRNEQQKDIVTGPIGLTIDSSDDKYIYMGSAFSGLTRFNLDDPQDVLHMANASNYYSNLPGYVKMHEDLSWKRSSGFTQPLIDADGVMWTSFLNYGGDAQLWYWTPEDRAASKAPASFRPWKIIPIKGVTSELMVKTLPLRSSVNKGIILMSTNSAGNNFIIYDTKGTLNTRQDDDLTIMRGILDQDGGVVSTYGINTLFEDEDSGTVWVGCQYGLFFFQPRTAQKGQSVWNRVKVSRNDGTSLADYLLNGINVTHITADRSKRKWICTQGGGIVVTSADGRTVIGELTTENSALPSNNVFYCEYNPESNSMLISTEYGICEYFISGSATAAEDSGVRAYPNPVAPDYYGWVTIDGLMDRAHVKIVDAQGNLVRELGVAETGTLQWDVLNLYGKRVKTGVYYVMAASRDGKESAITKILVMN